MLLLRTVTVKSRVTPGLKEELARETREELSRLEREIRALERELNERGEERAELRAELVRSREERLARRDQLLRRLEDVAGLQLGQEVVRGRVQGLVEVRPGDQWPETLTAEIVVEDGIILAVRDGTTVAVAAGEGTSNPPQKEGR